jgi:hypothetical protein
MGTEEQSGSEHPPREYSRTLGLTIARNDSEGADMPQTRRAKQAGSAALDRLRASIEAAETALKDLRGEVSRNSRNLLKDIGTTLKATRRNLTRSRRRIAKDLEQIEQALVKGKAAARPAPKRARSCTARQRRPFEQGGPPHELEKTDSEETQGELIFAGLPLPRPSIRPSTSTIAFDLKDNQPFTTCVGTSARR